jgi:protein-tyrosine kinase
MGRIFQALKRAEKEGKTEIYQPISYDPKPQPYKTYLPLDTQAKVFPAWCQELWSKCVFNTKSLKTILFTRVSSGGGCTTTLGYYAVYLASRMGTKVLVLDLNSIDPSGLKRFYSRQDTLSMIEMFTPKAIQRVKSFESLKRNLAVVTNDGEPFDEISNWVKTPDFPCFLEKASTQFDLVLIDSAPVQHSVETRVLCSKVDGVILTVEAGATRGASALKAKKELAEAGANLIGAIITKRKYHIPYWLYTRL